jgi:hypothetical protein
LFLDSPLLLSYQSKDGLYTWSFDLALGGVWSVFLALGPIFSFSSFEWVKEGLQSIKIVIIQPETHWSRVL